MKNFKNINVSKRGINMQNAYNQFIRDFSNTICNLTENKVFSHVIFLCVGTDRITGDTFGPIVGHKLKRLYEEVRNIEVIGDLDDTVCDTNIECVMQNIRNNFDNPFIVAIDSALSSSENVGRIIVEDRGILLGQGMGKNKMSIGDMSIKGVVARNLGNPKCNLQLLQNTSLSLVLDMAETVSQGIYASIQCE